MTTTEFSTALPELPASLPDHTQLPESDGTFVFAERAGGKNFQEHPQSILLTDSIDQFYSNYTLTRGTALVKIVAFTGA